MPTAPTITSAYAYHVSTPLGPITLIWGSAQSNAPLPSLTDPLYLMALFFADHEPKFTHPWLELGRKNPNNAAAQEVLRHHPDLRTALKWLEQYFSGHEPEVPLPQLIPLGTPFALKVWRELSTIAYGTTITYGELAHRLFPKQGKNMARAVGGAVGHNPIALMIPCHRIIGANGKLTGYAYGIERKRKLLELEAQACATKRKQTQASSHSARNAKFCAYAHRT